MSRTKDAEFDYQAYMKDYAPDPDKIHRGPEARQKRREAAIHNSRGSAYGEKGEIDRAIGAFTKAIELNPNYAVAYNNRGLAYRKKGDYDRAIVDYTIAKELNPHDKDVYNDYRIWLAAIIQSCDEAIINNPDDASLHYNRGLARLHLQAWEKAKTDMTIARSMGADIIALFHNIYENIREFEQKNEVKLPADLARMLTPRQ